MSGRARLNYLRPEATDPSVKARFRELVEKDKGRALYQYLESKKRAADFRLQTNSEDGWFVSFGKSILLDGINNIAHTSGEVANPGPFHGEVDFFSLSTDSSAEQDIYSLAEYRQTIEKHSGIKVYRDGFGIRVSKDWLNLGGQWTGRARITP